MKSNFLNFLIVILACVLLISCHAWKDSIKSNGGKKQAIQNIIIDYTHSEGTRKNEVYYISEESGDDSQYLFSIYREENVVVHLKDSVGAEPQNFSTEFFEYKNRLFLKDNSNVKITEELIEKLKSYNAVDSTYFKLESGEISSYNIPVYDTGTDFNFVGYILCKDDLSNYVKGDASGYYFLEHRDNPKIDCNNPKNNNVNAPSPEQGKVVFKMKRSKF